MSVTNYSQKPMEWMAGVKAHALLCPDKDKLTVQEPWELSLMALTPGHGALSRKAEYTRLLS